VKIPEKNLFNNINPSEPFEERQTFAIYMEGLLQFTMKRSMHGKHGKWNITTTTKTWHPFHFRKVSAFLI
jgi:hypothetical protein